MKPTATVGTFARLRNEPAWRLLAANLAPQILAILQHLLYDTHRTLPASTLYARLTDELQNLRDAGHELQGNAAYYLKDWVDEKWLERRYPEGSDDEEFELTEASLQVLRMLNGLNVRRAVATESRLALVMDQLAQLTTQTDDNPESRLRLLYEQREALDAQIEAVAAGKVPVLAPDRAIERMREILALASELTEDFRRVRDEFGRLNRNFQERIIQDDGNRGQVLTDLFAGVDVIAQSPEGRTFAAFWRLLTDPEQSALLEASIDSLGKREFVALLDRAERTFLYRLTRTLLDRAGTVSNTQTGFARRLRSFVQSREYLTQRRLAALLKSARTSALSVRDTLRPESTFGPELPLSTATYRSVGQWSLHTPSRPIDTDPLQLGAPAAITLEEIAGAVSQSEIDFKALAGQIRYLLAERSQCSIGSVLEAFPATQGLGSVAGLITMAVRYGEIHREHSESVEWTTGLHQHRRARIPLFYFVSERAHELPR